MNIVALNRMTDEMVVNRQIITSTSLILVWNVIEGLERLAYFV